MHACRPWLPETAIAAGLRDVPLPRLLDDWSAKWFAASRATLDGEPAVTAALAVDDGRWEVADGLALMRAPGVEQALIACLFGPRREQEPLTPADQAALGTVAETCIDDLRARLAAAFRLPPEARWLPAAPGGDGGRWWVWQVEAGRELRLMIAAAEALVVRRVRAAFPPPGRSQAMMPLAAALARQTVGVSALVGRCRLTAADVGGLGIGDVVVLDSAVGDAVALAVDRGPTTLSCAVDERDGHLNLLLVDR